MVIGSVLATSASDAAWCWQVPDGERWYRLLSQHLEPGRIKKFNAIKWAQYLPFSMIYEATQNQDYICDRISYRPSVWNPRTYLHDKLPIFSQLPLEQQQRLEKQGKTFTRCRYTLR